LNKKTANLSFRFTVLVIADNHL
jgi:hypothetical protein